MEIRRAVPDDRAVLLDIWLRAVRATHTFLSAKDIQELHPLVVEYLAGESEIWILRTDSGVTMGFMGLAENKIESLFLGPEYHGQGGGRRLIQHARELRGELTVDVNEQNPKACRFYEACGFRVEGRSEVDDGGRPFPLLHLRLPVPPLTSAQGREVPGD